MGSPDFKRPSNELIDAFSKLPTANVSDALDRLRIRGGCEGLRPIGVRAKLCGPAFTARYIPVKGKAAGVGDYIDEARAGDVIVIDNGGRTYCTVWGDLLTMVAVRNKLAGTIIDGVCRDVDGILDLNYNMYTKGRFMVTGKDRAALAEKCEPVSICHIQVIPGDIVCGDSSGVCIVPLDRAEEVLTHALKIAEAEEAIEKEIQAGNTLVGARQKFNYEKLQRPVEED